MDTKALRIDGDCVWNELSFEDQQRLTCVTGQFDIRKQTDCTIPNLKTVGVLLADKSEDLRFPSLEVADAIDGRGAVRLSFPALRSGGGLFLIGSKSVCFHQLQKVSRFLNAKGAEHLSFPVLYDAGMVCVDDSKNISMPIIERVTFVFSASYVSGVSFPTLRSVGTVVRVVGSNDLNFPSLENIGMSVEAGASVGLAFPVLKRVGGDVAAFHSENLSFPVLDRVDGKLMLEDSSGFSAPKLKNVGRIEARGSSNLNLNSLVAAPLSHAENALRELQNNNDTLNQGIK